jgi:hypothetical protein
MNRIQKAEALTESHLSARLGVITPAEAKILQEVWEGLKAMTDPKQQINGEKVLATREVI